MLLRARMFRSGGSSVNGSRVNGSRLHGCRGVGSRLRGSRHHGFRARELIICCLSNHFAPLV